MSTFRICLVVLVVVAVSSIDCQGGGGARVKRGGFGRSGGYGGTGGYAYSADLLIGSGVGGNLAYESAQRNFFALNAADLGNAFDVGDSANAIAKAARTSAAAGSKFKGGYGRR